MCLYVSFFLEPNFVADAKNKNKNSQSWGHGQEVTARGRVLLIASGFACYAQEKSTMRTSPSLVPTKLAVWSDGSLVF